MSKRVGTVLPRGAVMFRTNPHLARGIPVCPECDNPAVRWRGIWACRMCFALSTPQGKETSIEQVFPNRAARRASR